MPAERFNSLKERLNLGHFHLIISRTDRMLVRSELLDDKGSSYSEGLGRHTLASLYNLQDLMDEGVPLSDRERLHEIVVSMLRTGYAPADDTVDAFIKMPLTNPSYIEGCVDLENNSVVLAARKQIYKHRHESDDFHIAEGTGETFMRAYQQLCTKLDKTMASTPSLF